jgi:tripartite ATP-independent transporter DctM subunit
LENLITGIVALIVLLALIFQGVPIGISFAVVGVAGIMLMRGPEVGLYSLGSIPFTWASAQMILPVPLFVLMGYLAFYAGISRDLFVTGHRWMGKYAGGLAMGTMVACAGFAACCGAAPAAAATMGAIAYPEMAKRGYHNRLATGCLAAGAGVSILIPPSVPMIIYGSLSQTSVGHLFIAGVLPGLILTGAYVLTIYVLCRRNPNIGPPSESFTLRERLASLKGVWGMLLLFALVIGGLFVGAFTPTEAGAIGAFGAFLIGLARRRLSLANLLAAAKETVRVTGFVVTLIIGAQIFNTFLDLCRFTSGLSTWISSLGVSPYVILGFVLIIYLLLGMFLDIMAIILLTIPTLAPIMSALGFDLIWFGVIVVLLAMTGFLTPPIGMNAFVVQGVTKVPLEEIFRGVTPFVVVTIAIIVLLIILPQIVLLLPSIAK